MQYMGGKARQAAHISPIITAVAKAARAAAYYEPFLGGASILERVAQHVPAPEASDVHEDLMLMWQALVEGWEPPTAVSRKEYQSLKDAAPSPLRGFVGFGCSFGGKWFGGYATQRVDAKHTGDICGASRKGALRKAAAMPGARLTCRSYVDLDPRPGSLIYCDPPYAGTTRYSGSPLFDHAAFWQRAREWADLGCTVLVSEYTAPKDIPIVWERSAAMSLNANRDVSMERLFMLSGSKNTISAFTWQRYRSPLPATAPAWRRQEKIMVSKEAAAKHPFAGMSVLDVLWEELDGIMDQLMEEGAPDIDTFAEEIQESGRPRAKQWYGVLKEWGELRGQAQGVAYAIALVTNPYACDLPAIKAEAKKRWDERQK